MENAGQRMTIADEPWPARPWIMALLCAIAGALFVIFARKAGDADGQHYGYFVATAIAATTISFVLTSERRRLLWSAVFAVLWGVVLGGVAWNSSGYNLQGNLFEWPFLASVFALLLAAPLFQTARDAGWLIFDPLRVCHHMWVDAVLGAASLLFVGIVFLLVHLVGSLFALIGITLVNDIINQAEVGWAIAGAAFGGSMGMLRERDALVATVLRLVVVILSALAPILAVALALFLLSLPITGLGGLWNGWLSAAALTLAAGAGAIVLMNAALGLGDEDRPPRAILMRSAQLLALVVLPLAFLAFTALVLRVQQYGWTPERIWGVLAAVVALFFGGAGWLALWRGRTSGLAEPIRRYQTRLTLAVCGLALFLSLPIVDFGGISARDQLARLQRGEIKAADFDWRAMAFEFGPRGRAVLRDIAAKGTTEQKTLANNALAMRDRYNSDVREVKEKPLAQRIASVPAGRPIPPKLLQNVNNSGVCRVGDCRIVWLDEKRVMVLGRRDSSSSYVVEPWAQVDNDWRYGDGATEAQPGRTADIGDAPVEVRTVNRRQIFVGDEPVGDVFE